MSYPLPRKGNNVPPFASDYQDYRPSSRHDLFYDNKPNLAVPSAPPHLESPGPVSPFEDPFADTEEPRRPYSDYKPGEPPIYSSRWVVLLVCNRSMVPTFFSVGEGIFKWTYWARRLDMRRSGGDCRDLVVVRINRVLMMVCNLDSLRQTVRFPFRGRGYDIMRATPFASRQGGGSFLRATWR